MLNEVCDRVLFADRFAWPWHWRVSQHTPSIPSIRMSRRRLTAGVDKGPGAQPSYATMFQFELLSFLPFVIFFYTPTAGRT